MVDHRLQPLKTVETDNHYFYASKLAKRYIPYVLEQTILSAGGGTRKITIVFVSLYLKHLQEKQNSNGTVTVLIITVDLRGRECQ